MRPVRQQRVGRGYLDAVMRDAGRPYEFRGGLRRLLNAGVATPARAAYTYGSLPFNLRYLQHSVYGYGNEWSVAPAFGNRYPIPRPSVTASEDDGGYPTEPGPGEPEAWQRRPVAVAPTPDSQACPSAPGAIVSPPNPPVSDTRPQTPPTLSQPPAHTDERISSDRLRQGSPPRVTTRSIGDTRNSIRPATGLFEESTDHNGAVAERDHGGQTDKPSVQHVLSRLARQLEAHNFGGQRQDVERQFSPDEPPGRTGTAAEIHPPGQSPPEDPVYPMQRYQRPPGPSAAGVAVFGSGLNQPVSVRVPSPPETFHEVSAADTPVQAQPRSMNNLKKRAAQRRTGGKAEPETPAGEPVKAGKRPSVKRTRPVVRHTIVRRAAAPAFWERSYLSHAALRLYK